VITSRRVFSRKSVKYMNAGIRVANFINFSWTKLSLDLYSFSSSVSSFFPWRQITLLGLALSSLTFSLLLMIVSMMLSPRARQPSMRPTASLLPDRPECGRTRPQNP